MNIKELQYIPNILSLSRFVLAVITLFVLNADLYLESIILIICIWVTDILDGYLARSLNEVSDFGKIVDPIADKFTIVTIAIVLVLKDIIPLWFVIIVALRDILILAGGVIIKYRKNQVMQSNYTGKLAVFSIGLTIINFVFFQFLVKTYPYNSDLLNFWELLSNILLFISLMMIVISFAIYFYIFIKFVNKKI